MPGCLRLSWGNHQNCSKTFSKGCVWFGFLLSFCSVFYMRQVNTATVEGAWGVPRLSPPPAQHLLGPADPDPDPVCRSCWKPMRNRMWTVTQNR